MDEQMKKFNKLILFPFVLIFLFAGKNLKAQSIEASFETTQEGTININYEFNGDRDKDYNVTVVLKKKSDPTFSLVPNNLTGDIGIGKFADAKRTIIWTPTSDEQQSLQGSDFYFIVNAKEIETESGGGIPWYVYVGGAAVAGGVAAILLLNKSSSNNGGSTQTTIPDPPGRPSKAR
jgi:hypothetical protein